MAEKQYTGGLAPLERWLDAVTSKDLMKGAAIVAATGLLAAGVAYKNAGQIELPVAGMGGAVQAFAAVGVFVMTLLGWLLSTLIYHVSAHLLGGKGDRNRMFALTGYATLPALIQQLARFVEYWFLGQKALTNAGGIPGILLDHFNVFAIISLVFVGVAVMVNYGLKRRRAAVVALIPTIILLALGLFSLRAVSGTATSGGGLFGLRRLG